MDKETENWVNRFMSSDLWDKSEKMAMIETLFQVGKINSDQYDKLMCEV